MLVLFTYKVIIDHFKGTGKEQPSHKCHSRYPRQKDTIIVYLQKKKSRLDGISRLMS